MGVKQNILNLSELKNLELTASHKLSYDDVIQLTVVLFDGPFSNQFDIIHFEQFITIKDLVYKPEINKSLPK